DNAGHVGESIFNVTIVDLTDPIADAGLDLTIENGQEAVFDGSLCSDNGMIKYYNWTFEYNETQVLLQGQSVIHKFMVPGIYQVTLRIEDEFGNNAEDTLIVTVIDTIPPVPRISGNTQILEGESMILNGLQSTDNGRIAKYLWTFEDGAPVEYEGPTINHRFSLKGFHEVTLTVFDEWNNYASTNVTIDVLDIASPLADAGPDMIVGVGRQVTLDGSGSTDDGRMVRYEWIFEYQGKEKKLEGMVSIFTFDVLGTYIVTLKVFDQSNNIGSDEVEIKVVNYGYVRGIVLDTKGTPVKGAIVEIVASDGNRYTAETLANGSFYIEIPHGSFTWRILYDGYKELEGSGTVGLLSDSNLEIPAMEKKEDAGIGPIMFIVPVVIVLVLVIGLILFFVLRKKKPESEPQAVSEEKDEFAVKEINEDSPPIVPPMDPTLSEFTQSPPIMEEDNEEEQAPAEAVGDPFEGIGSEEIEKLINSNA
ncbi:MAG: PKD domain-containing protein, partial [Candidatus Thermoplasmatota archaeon]|nr:PKD domain-containing protein [Candidatus Thermoplasmatota archaeon]